MKRVTGTLLNETFTYDPYFGDGTGSEVRGEGSHVTTETTGNYGMGRNVRDHRGGRRPISDREIGR